MASGAGPPCSPFQFENQGSASCEPCAKICDPSRPRQYEQSVCNRECQAYTAMMDELGRHQSSDGTARILGGVGLALGLLALAAVLALAFLVYRRPRRLIAVLQAKVRDIENHAMQAKMADNNNRGMDIGRDSLCTVSQIVSEAETRMSAAPQQPPSTLPLSVGAATTLSVVPPPPPERHPSEDSTLDYAAYDNPALSPSSSPLPPTSGGNGSGKAMDAVLDAVLDHSALPGSVPLGRGAALHSNGAIANHVANGSVARMESSF